MDPVKYSKALRSVRERPLKFSHEGFLDAIRREPEEQTHRAVYADWLEENEQPVANDTVLPALRNVKGPMWARLVNGVVHAGRGVALEDFWDSLGSLYPYAVAHNQVQVHHLSHGPAGSFGVTEHDLQYPFQLPYRVRNAVTADFVAEHPTLDAAVEHANRLADGNN